jgi:hypothetical protein
MHAKGYHGNRVALSVEFFFPFGCENSDANDAKTAKISVVNALTPCIS